MSPMIAKFQEIQHVIPWYVHIILTAHKHYTKEPLTKILTRTS